MIADQAAFLRGISNVPMQPFRTAFERLGFTEVETFGASGNVLFCANETDASALESRVGETVGAEAFVRRREELATIVAHNPYADVKGASVFLAKHLIGQSQAESLFAGGFEGDPPVISGANVYFVHPTRRPGVTGVVDFERALGVRGTMRSARVIARVLGMMQCRGGCGRTNTTLEG
jgi:uncharacterized protein (DUF1697 family)